MESIFSIQSSYLLTIDSSEVILNHINLQNINVGFFYSTKSKLSLNSICIFINNGLFSMISKENDDFFFVNSTIAFIKRDSAISNYKTNLVFQSNLFIANEGKKGGAIFSEESNVLFQNNFFLNNSAEYGGGIYFSNFKGALYSIKLFNNSFSWNTAELGGGAFFSIFNIPTNENNIFRNNSAKYGNDFASPPIKLHDLKENDTQILNYLPSSKLPFFNMILEDVYHNFIKVRLFGKATIEFANDEIYQIFKLLDESKNKKRIEGETVSDYEQGMFVFKNIHLDFKPNSSVLLSITSNLIHTTETHNNLTFPHFLDSQNQYHYLFNVTSIDCPIG